MDIVFYLATACYAGAAVCVGLYLAGAPSRVLTLAHRLAAGAAACLVVTFLLRWSAWRLLPLTTIADSLNLLALLSTILMLWVVRKDSAPTLACFYVPPLAAICLINATVAHDQLHLAPRELSGIPLTIHVGLAFLAFALFFLASMTSVAYIFQAHHLKNHHTTGLFQRLPSLEQLDRTLSRLIGYGYPFFVVTLILGLLWAWVDRDLLGTLWWLAPKVLLSWVMVGFYAATFHARRSGRLRGPKLAYVVFFGFSLLLITYLVLALTNLNTYNFWEAVA